MRPAFLAATLLSLLQTGDRIVASDKLYGRTAQLFQQEFSRFGAMLSSPEAKEAFAAFAERRQPDFSKLSN